MLISKQKRKENIAEYLLYMWQIEDMIRALEFDINKIKVAIIEKYDQPEEVKNEMVDWYENLIEMMKIEHVKESGHLQINKNIVIDLTDLHLRLLKETKEVAYQTAFYQALPEISAFRNKNNDQDTPDIEICFTILYGILILNLKGQELTDDTKAAMAPITKYISVLAKKFKLYESGDLELN